MAAGDTTVGIGPSSTATSASGLPLDRCVGMVRARQAKGPSRNSRLDHLARSQLHLLQIMEEIEGRGAKLVSLMDNIDTGTATGKMVVGVLAVLAEFERNLLLERCAAGVKIARQRNVRFGRPPKLTPSLIRQVLLAHDDASTTVPETCRVLGISKSSYYAALRQGRWQALETAEAA